MVNENSILSILKSISRMSAWRVIFFTDSHTCFIAIFYILSVMKLTNYVTLSKSLILLASLELYLIYGVLINDFFDMPTDKNAEDFREIHTISPKYVFIIILLVVACSFYVTIYLINQDSYTLIYSLAYVLATLYSATPFRLKSRGVFGVIINMLIEQALPVLLISGFYQFSSLDIIFLLLLVSLRQLELIIIHQYVDYEGDKKTGVNTFVVELGLDRTLTILKYLQPLVGLLYVLFSLIIVLRLNYFAFFFIPLIAGYFLLYNLKRSKLFTSEPGRFGPPRYYADEEKVGRFRSSPSSFLGISFEGPFSLYAGAVLSFKFPPYVVLLLLSLASQYYFVKGHYSTAIRGALQFVERRRWN